jgi:hypothetical protein
MDHLVFCDNKYKIEVVSLRELNISECLKLYYFLDDKIEEESYIPFKKKIVE